MKGPFLDVMIRVGAKVYLTWVGTGRPQTTTVTRAEAPEVLEYGDIRWESRFLTCRV